MNKMDKQQDQPQMLQPGMYQDDYPDPMPFAGIEKSTVVQETKIFAASTIDERKCLLALVKLLYLAAQGEELTETEATDIFFATTKLFQSNDQDLRRHVYVLMKELASSASQTLIATQTLCKDINSGNDMYKANAIRTLRSITEVTLLGPGERYLAQAVVDQNTNVASAALVTGIHMIKDAPELIKKWSNEVSERMKQRPSVMVPYHALALLHRLKKNNRLFVLKQVQQAEAQVIRSPLALCLLIRMCTETLQDDFSNNGEMYKFVQSSLRHGSDMVVFEAAKALCSLKELSTKDLGQVVLVLQLYLSSPKSVQKFAALRLLNKMATTHPLAVATCSIDVETLFTDPNKNIATLAITTILMTGSEHSIDRLMKQISKFLSDISDEFRAVVIESMKVLGKKFPHKHHVLLHFLSDALREEGGFEYKMSIVETIANLVETSPSAKEEGLMALCELIEDCEYTKISQRVLSLLGKEGPSNPTPSKFVRFIYNRVLLEAPSVRAAAVSALAKFAAKCEPLRDSVLTLLHRAAMDNDDEVRDRAVFYITMLELDDKSTHEMFINEVEADTASAVPQATAAGEAPPPPETTGGGLRDLLALPAEDNKWVQDLEAVPQLKKLGKPFKSSEPMALTEKDEEMVVTCCKHCYLDYMVLHFRVNNTLEDQTFYNVQVRVEVHEDEDLESMEPLFAIPATQIEPNTEKSCFVCFKRDVEAGYPTGSCGSVIIYGEEEDGETSDFKLQDDVVFNLSDYLRGTFVPSFSKAWEDAGTEEFTEDTYELHTVTSLQNMATDIIEFYSFTASDGSAEVNPDQSKVSHTLLLSGQVCNEPPEDILIKAKIALTQSGSISLTLSIKGGYDDLRTHLAESLTDS